MAAARVLVHKIQHYERMQVVYPWSAWLQARLATINRGPFFLSLAIVFILVFGCGQSRAPLHSHALPLTLIYTLGVLQAAVGVVALVQFILIESPLLVLQEPKSDPDSKPVPAGERQQA